MAVPPGGRSGAERASVVEAGIAERALVIAYRAAIGVLGDRHAAEDVAQDVARRSATGREPGPQPQP